MTQLVSVRSFPLVDGKRILPEGVVYIGRAVPRVGLKASKWANPYRVGGLRHPEGHIGPRPCDCPRLDHYLAYWSYSTWLDMRLLIEPRFLEPLRGADAIACWCDRRYPDDLGRMLLWCHGTLILDRLETHRPEPEPGERIEFGRHAMPPAEAETAPAWPSLASVRAAADAKFRREQRKVRA